MTDIERIARQKAAGMQDVTWRSGSPHRPLDETVEFSFTSACGAALRFRMPKGSARHLYASLGEALYGFAFAQPERSSGIPSPSGEPKEGQAP